MFRPLTDPSEVTFSAYSVTASPARHLNPGTPNPRPMSGALLRALLINAIECGGALALDDLSKTVGFTYADGTFHVMVQEARPLPTPRTPACGECGQWKSEHRNPNATACDAFDVQPRPDSPANPLCGECRQPKTHHGRRYTVACGSFTTSPPLPEYADKAVARDMEALSVLLAEAGVRYEPRRNAHGVFLVHADDGPWVLCRMLDRQRIPGSPALRFFAGFRGGPSKTVGPMSAATAVRFFGAKVPPSA